MRKHKQFANSTVKQKNILIIYLLRLHITNALFNYIGAK